MMKKSIPTVPLSFQPAVCVNSRLTVQPGRSQPVRRFSRRHMSCQLEVLCPNTAQPDTEEKTLEKNHDNEFIQGPG